jgi:hypothetical protein
MQIDLNFYNTEIYGMAWKRNTRKMVVSHHWLAKQAPRHQTRFVLHSFDNAIAMQ